MRLVLLRNRKYTCHFTELVNILRHLCNKHLLAGIISTRQQQQNTELFKKRETVYHIHIYL